MIMINENMIPSGCSAHNMLHNAVKFAGNKCEFDVENLVLKVYGHLSYHAQRVQRLKEFFANADINYQNIVRHVATRWLSLHPAIEQILTEFPALKDYFSSLGESCPIIALKNILTMQRKPTAFLDFLTMRRQRNHKQNDWGASKIKSRQKRKQRFTICGINNFWIVLLKIFPFVASIPSSNAAAERVFSLCEEHVKAELQVKVNFPQQCCKDFYDFVVKNKKLLKCAKSQEKYTFKKK